MTKDEIAKLPTPETDATDNRTAKSEDGVAVIAFAQLAGSLEQRLVAVTADLEHARRWFDQLTTRDAERYAETLAAIKELSK